MALQVRHMVHCHKLVHEDHDMMTHWRWAGPAPERERWEARIRRLRVHHSVCGGRPDSTVGDHERRRLRKTLEIKGVA
jgi:hypothetical protein